MATLKSICVYCGANPGNDTRYSDAAAQLGREMAIAGIDLVYGGASIGLMGAVAKAVLENDGVAIGVIPQFLKDREVMLTEVSELVVTTDMHERKRIMFERADAFVALPGGIGTLEEVVEITTWAQLDQHTKPILIANIGGFWDPLIAQFQRMDDDGFLHKRFLNDERALPITFCAAIEDIIPTLRGLVADLSETALAPSSAARMM